LHELAIHRAWLKNFPRPASIVGIMFFRKELKGVIRSGVDLVIRAQVEAIVEPIVCRQDNRQVHFAFGRESQDMK
jgi:hypothetical protein